MSKKLLKRISLASAMILCTQPLLSMENTNPFSDFGEATINRPQAYAQQQQPQFPMNVPPHHNGFQWMNQVPQNQVIQLLPQYVMTPLGAHVIYQTTYQTVYSLPQPQQYIPMPMFQNQQSPMPLGTYPENNFIGQVGMNGMTQQGPYIHQNQCLQPGFQNNDADTQQGSGGMKRRLEIDSVMNNKRQKNEMVNIPMLLNNFDEYPDDIKREILKIVSISNLKEIDNVDKLKPMGNPIKLIKLVCKGWKSIVEAGTPFFFANEVIRSAYRLTDTDDEFKIYQRFLNGKLIFRPTEGSDEGMIELLISKLWNPLGGTFNLSECGDTYDYLSISTGYRKGKIAENAHKVEIWFAPRFLIERELGTTAGHFKPIMDDWIQDLAPVGMFWTDGGLDKLNCYNYLTTENMDNLCKMDLYENWGRCLGAIYGDAGYDEHYTEEDVTSWGGGFHVHFVKCAKDEVALI